MPEFPRGADWILSFQFPHSQALASGFRNISPCPGFPDAVPLHVRCSWCINHPLLMNTSQRDWWPYSAELRLNRRQPSHHRSPGWSILHFRSRPTIGFFLSAQQTSLESDAHIYVPSITLPRECSRTKPVDLVRSYLLIYDLQKQHMIHNSAHPIVPPITTFSSWCKWFQSVPWIPSNENVYGEWHTT
jgi:hypothetical protein